MVGIWLAKTRPAQERTILSAFTKRRREGSLKHALLSRVSCTEHHKSTLINKTGLPRYMWRLPTTSVVCAKFRGTNHRVKCGRFRPHRINVELQRWGDNITGANSVIIDPDTMGAKQVIPAPITALSSQITASTTVFKLLALSAWGVNWNQYKGSSHCPPMELTSCLASACPGCFSRMYS